MPSSNVPSRLGARSLALAAGLALCASASSALAQSAPIPFHNARLAVDSGVVANTTVAGHDVVFSTLVEAPGASWVRLYFGDTVLAGNMFNPDASFIRVTSMLDGGVQVLNPRQLRDWHNSTAYFNGDSVVVELLASQGTGNNRLTITGIDIGEIVQPNNPESICGPTDDRVLSSDPRAARLMPIGCSVWLINDAAKCFITAGHCISNGNTTAVAQFNVPLSNSNGSTVNPPPQHQYPVDTPSIQSNGGQGVGNDWAYLGFKANGTGNTPFQNQNAAFDLTTTMPPTGGQLRITGYGTVSAPVSPTWNQVQKTHVGQLTTSTNATLSYTADTTGGNSGSPVINESTNTAIGVHTHGGCTSTGGANSGSSLNVAAFTNARNNPTGICVPLGLTFQLPSGTPALVNPNGGTTIAVNVLPSGGNTPQPGTGMFHYNIGSGFVSIPMSQGSPNSYTATVPAVPCGQTITYFFSAESTGGTMYTHPANAPTTTFSSLSANGVSTQTYMDVDFEAGLPAGSSATGLWNLTTSCKPNASCDGPSVAYYGVTSQCNYSTGAATSGVLSMPLNLANAAAPITLEYCYARVDEGGNPWDLAEVRFNGVPIDSNPPQAATFTTRSVDVSAIAGQVGTLEFFYDSVDSVANTTLGWMVDGVKVSASAPVCNTCYADCDQSGALNIFDYICFGNAYSAQQSYADCDGNGSFNIFDYICFGNEYSAGCP